MVSKLDDINARIAAARAAKDWDLHDRLWEERRSIEVETDEAAIEPVPATRIMTARKPYLPRRSRISHAATIAAYAGVMGGALLAGIYWPVPRQPAFIIEAESRSGRVHMIGAGASCATAWRSAELPADWTRTICRRAR